jgi:hypothetical protein
MPNRSRIKRPKDPVERAKLIFDIATGEIEDKAPETGKNPAAVALGKLGGKKGGKARMASLKPKERKTLAVKAASERWTTEAARRLKMTRQEFDRVTESDLMMPSLRLMAKKPDGFITTTDLVRELTSLFEPKGVDAEILEGRNDTYFSQKVRNIISHKKSPTSFIEQGYAEYIESAKGLKITQKGKDFVKQFGG